MEHQGPTSWLLQIPFLPHEEALIHVNGALVVFGVILVGSIVANWLIRGRLETYLVPSGKFDFVGLVDVTIEGLYKMIESTLGHDVDKHFAYIASIFIFILLNNVLGLLPYAAAPTSSVNTTFALGVCTFFYYNVMGIKTHGLGGYLKHFLMGMGIFGLPIALLESISHFIRPVSLGIRLFVNMFVDHSVVLAFHGVFAWLLPVPLLLLGLLVSMIQAFVFATLTAVYVQMATEHDH